MSCGRAVNPNTSHLVATCSRKPPFLFRAALYAYGVETILINRNNMKSMNRVKKLKVTTIGDNLVYYEGHGQSGLSLLLELIDAREKPRKVLFDTGDNKEALMHNIKFLKLKLKNIDAIVLSHGHRDHTAATVEVVEAAGGTKVYGHPHTFIQRFVKRKGKRGDNIGVPKGQGIAEIEKGWRRGHALH